MSRDDALSLWIGRVVRSHALLEYEVDLVHRLICTHTRRPREWTSVVSLDQVIADTRKRLRALDLREGIRAAGDEALRAAKAASDLRNRVAHDIWLPSHETADVEAEQWNVFQRSGDPTRSYAEATRRPLEDVVSAHLVVERTRVRLSGLFMSLHASWTATDDASAVPLYIAMMKDRFELRANGDVITKA